jgi:uncharacterized protein (TIGR02466 family)
MEVFNPFCFPIIEFIPENSQQLASEVRDRTLEFEKSDQNGGILSEEWNRGGRASSAEDYEKGGYTSFYSQRIMEMPDFEGIHRAAIDAFNAYTDAMGRGSEPFYIQHSWVSSYGRGHFVPEHVHTFSHLSCVFYADADEDTGAICFKNPALPIYGMCQDQHSNLFNDVQRLAPKVGRFYVFPSFMPHYTEAHESDVKRVIFSANMILTKSYLGRPMWESLQGE